MGIGTMRGYFALQSSFSNPHAFASEFERLPNTLPELIAVIDGLLIHADLANFIHLQDDSRKDEVELHTVPQILGRVMELEAAPLTQHRPRDRRAQVTCAQYALLLASVLRFQGFAARVRYGFPTYYVSPRRPLMPDHTVCEYLPKNANTWVRVDAELGGVLEKRLAIGFDPWDIPSDKFLSSAQVMWDLLLERTQNADALYGFGSLHGYDIVIPTLFHDAACLMKNEPLPWHTWGLLEEDHYREIPFVAEFLAQLAQAILDFDTEPQKLITLMNQNPYLQMSGGFKGTREHVYLGAS